MLKKLRHPGIISVHKVEETRTSLVIETEPVTCSIADALRRDARSFDVRSAARTVDILPPVLFHVVVLGPLA